MGRFEQVVTGVDAQIAEQLLTLPLIRPPTNLARSKTLPLIRPPSNLTWSKTVRYLKSVNVISPSP